MPPDPQLDGAGAVEREGGISPHTREHRGRTYPVSPAHPVADLLPWMSDDELHALADDIRHRGQKLTIKTLPDGRILDGRNRELACRIAGIGPWYETIRPTESEIPALVASLNLHRRHLTNEQKRQLVAAILKSEPERSDRSVAKVAAVDHKTVASVRTKLAEGGEIPQLPKHRSEDGASYAARRQPEAHGEPDPVPSGLQDLRRAVNRLDSLVCNTAGEDTPVGRTLAEELRQNGVALTVDDDPVTDMATGVVACGRRVIRVPVIENLRVAIEETVTRLAAGKAVQP